jgi:hypothetical protein
VIGDNVRRKIQDLIARAPTLVGDGGLHDEGLKLEVMINELTGKRVITGQQSKQAKVAAHVRTKATHAQWDEFDMEGVQTTIQLTRRFLADHLGG